MRQAFPFIAGCTVLVSFVGVAILFRAAFLPFKFIMTILIPLSAVFGLAVAVFQESWFEIVGAKSKDLHDGVSYMIPYNFLGALFGLAMDYDIFLFARVYEYRHEGYDNVSSVQKSLVETGPVVMTAGTFMCLSFFMMMISGIMCMAQMAFLYFFG